MKDFKIIATQKREIFEEKLKEYIKQGYEVKNTNMSIASTSRKSELSFKLGIEYAFYAYLEKEKEVV